MKVCLLTPQKLDLDPFPDDDWPCDPRPFLPDAEWHVGTLRKASAVKQVIGLVRKGFDVFFNLCDGAWDESSPGIEVVQALERLDVPFTGAASDFYEPTREDMKRVCRAWGLDSPAHVLASVKEDIERALDTLTFPMFVKHPSSYASIGLTRSSRVRSAAQLRKEAGRTMRAHGSALIEEFIEGREYTVLVAENPADVSAPTTYPPLEYEFPPGESFKHSDLKWVDYNGMKVLPVSESALDARLREVSSSFFLGLNGSGYGRCDIREDASGRLFLLEINANCGLYYPPKDASGADHALLLDAGGHAAFTRQTVAAALARHALRQRKWEVRPGRDGHDAVHATRALRKGETVVALEGRARALVTRSPLAKRPGGPLASWARRLAWPLSEGLWIDWAREPSAWTPFPHSCDPNAWLQGLDVVARRSIAPGEELSLEYATLHGEGLRSFRCDCGSPSCRGTVRGSDHLESFVAAYGRHVSPYVRERRRASPDCP